MKMHGNEDQFGLSHQANYFRCGAFPLRKLWNKTKNTKLFDSGWPVMDPTFFFIHGAQRILHDQTRSDLWKLLTMLHLTIPKEELRKSNRNETNKYLDFANSLMRMKRKEGVKFI